MILSVGVHVNGPIPDWILTVWKLTVPPSLPNRAILVHFGIIFADIYFTLETGAQYFRKVLYKLARNLTAHTDYPACVIPVDFNRFDPVFLPVLGFLTPVQISTGSEVAPDFVLAKLTNIFCL